MNPESLRDTILDFFEHIENYYGCTTEITEGIMTSIENIEAENTTWNLSEFQLLRSAYRKAGDRFMLEGKGVYYEIAAEKIIDFKHPGRHNYEFIEQYGFSVYRITRLHFRSKY
jgi:hypothetical protein